ncbi:MAG TPA: GAF domain-containing protein [Spirochaetia bacterium]|nr:GAF domain-containing protein [Spirochaetales bacterium]HRY78872.1 GAF domain-containing protein [Spirochaetia bacterium]HRZ89020.1 GAF domain-containing protein [Spirochaetia bacterium]
MTPDAGPLKTLLLVEDEALIALAERRTLERYGFRVRTAADGEGAVAAASEQDVDLVLMDINLGAGIDGTEAAKRILAARDLPLIFLSSHTEREVVERTEGITSYGYVVKNSDENVLVASIKMAFRLFEAKVQARAKEERITLLGRLLDAAPDSITIHDESGAFLYANRRTFALHGYSEDEFMALNLHDLDVPESEVLIEERIRKIRDAGEATFEVTHRRKDGTLLPLEVTVQTADWGGRFAMLSIARDRTERVRADREIRRSEARLASLLRINQYPARDIQDLLDYALDEAILLTESRIGYIYLYDEDRKLFTLNTWSKEVLHQCTVLEKQTVYELDKTGIWGEAVRQRKPILVNEYAAPSPLKKGLPEGHAPLRRFLTVPVFDEGRIIAVAGVANKEAEYDESDVRQLTLMMDAVWKTVRRRRAEDALERQLREKETLLREVHHRIKNNLASIGGVLRLQLDSVPDDASRTAILDAAARVESMRVVYDKLLVSGDYREVSVREYLEGLLAAILDLFPDTGRIRIEPDIQEFELGTRTVFPLGTIVNELITNSMKHAFPGRDRGSLGIRVAREGNEIVLEVKDDGRGLPEGFDPESSTGFGLQLVRMLAEQLNGSFSIRGGEGTTGVVRFKA